MIKSIFKLPFIGLVLKIASVLIVLVFAVLGGYSYNTNVTLDETIDDMRLSYCDTRSELHILENKVDAKRNDIEELLEEESLLEKESAILKERALKLDRDWQTVKTYKNKIEESGKKIEQLRKRIQQLGP